MQFILTIAPQVGYVAVVYDHDGAGSSWFDPPHVIYPDLSQGDGLNFVRETAVSVGLYIED